MHAPADINSLFSCTSRTYLLPYLLPSFLPPSASQLSRAFFHISTSRAERGGTAGRQVFTQKRRKKKGEKVNQPRRTDIYLPQEREKKIHKSFLYAGDGWIVSKFSGNEILGEESTGRTWVLMCHYASGSAFASSRSDLVGEGTSTSTAVASESWSGGPSTEVVDTSSASLPSSCFSSTTASS